MSSTWSNLGINLQGTGDNSGTWGQLTNVNLQDIDAAIAGVAPITLTGNTTLAFTTNSSSTTYTNEAGRNKIIVLSGSLSATTVTVTVPNIQKDYVVVNNSGATVVVSSGGSTTISIPTSTNAYIYSNGSSSIFFALPLPVATNAGGTTNQVQYNNAGAFAGSTNLTFNGTTLAMQTATVLNLTSTTSNIVTANVTTANVTSLTYVNATGTAANIANLNVITNGVLKIYNTANTQYTGLQVAAGATTTATFTLPSADGTSGQFLKTNGSGVLSFGAASAITWQSVQTTNFTASAGNGYPVNTTSAGITVTLPVSASTGDTIQIVDYAGTFGTNALTINPNGLKINGSTSNATISNKNEGLQLTYIDSTQGWKATLAANEGTNAAPQTYSINFLVVAGGGGGGSTYSGAGGGGGGFRTSTQTVNTGTAITVTVGDGGAGGVVSNIGTSGSNSSISGSGLTTITSAGGGGGSSGGAPANIGASGGSGGGGSAGTPPNTGGSGNTPSTSPSQGNNGGAGTSGAGSGAGGGGAGAVGSNVSGANGGAGGNGTASSITGTSVTYAGGGGGAGYTAGGGTAGAGGSGGGGNGSVGQGSAGTANLGGGGGGSERNPSIVNGGAGGKGVVILSVPTGSYSGTSTGSPTVTTSGSNTIMQFNGSGTYTA